MPKESNRWARQQHRIGQSGTEGLALLKLTKEEKTENQAGEAHVTDQPLAALTWKMLLVIYPEVMTRSPIQKVLMYCNVTKKWHQRQWGL